MSRDPKNSVNNLQLTTKTPRDIFTKNPETAHSNSCTTWQHSPQQVVGSTTAVKDSLFFTETAKNKESQGVTETGRSRCRQTRQEADSWPSALEMCCSCSELWCTDAMLLSMDNPTREFRKHS